MASGNNLKSYSWTPAAGLSCSNCPNPKAFPVANISYTLTAADSLGCDTVSVVTITIVKPVANISAVPDTICPGDSANLIASGGTHYLWSTSQTTESIWVKPTAITTYTVTAHRLSIEWALIDGVNDRGSDASEFAAFARPLGAHVNLIPLNRTPGYPVMGSTPERVRRFHDELVALGVNATIRATRGADIDAACGQLAATASGPATAADGVRLVRGGRGR